MDEKILARITDRCLDDRSIEQYTALAGRKATKTDTREVARNVVPLMVDQLDSKASKETKTAMKLHEYMMQAFDPKAAEDPKFASGVLSTLLGSKKGEIIAMNADTLLVHPFVIENMLLAIAPAVLRAYGTEFGRDVFRRGFGGPAPAPQPAPPRPEPARRPAPAQQPGPGGPGMGRGPGRGPAGGRR